MSNNSFPERPTRGFRGGRNTFSTATGSLVASKITSAEDSHPSDDASHPTTGQTWGKIVYR
ncbi:MAG TPA: hypothetical protein VK955_03500, partial [Xanthobacteraceae bacterium]|nr:hypothetical protein [Xanthobacteraceae bacterium]